MLILSCKKQLITIMMISFLFFNIFLQVGGNVAEKFQSKLYDACARMEKTIDSSACKCYSSQVTKRYNDVQLLTIYKLLKIPEANKMFVVVHSPEGIACKTGAVK